MSKAQAPITITRPSGPTRALVDASPRCGRDPAVTRAIVNYLISQGTRGASIEEIAAATGAASRPTSTNLVNARVRYGATYSIGSSSHHCRHYAIQVPEAEALESFKAWRKAEQEAIAQRARETRADRAALNASLVNATRAEAAARRAAYEAGVKQRREARQARKQQLDAIKAEQQHTNALAAKLKREAAAPSTATPGSTAGGRFERNATETITERTVITIAKRPLGRYELLEPREGGLRSLPLGKYLEQPHSVAAKALTGAGA
jgi:hypothetical protein